MLSQESSGFVSAESRNESGFIIAAPSSTKLGVSEPPFAWVPFLWSMERYGLLVELVDSDMWHVYELPSAANRMLIVLLELITAS